MGIKYDFDEFVDQESLEYFKKEIDDENETLKDEYRFTGTWFEYGFFSGGGYLWCCLKCGWGANFDDDNPNEIDFVCPNNKCKKTRED